MLGRTTDAFRAQGFYLAGEPEFEAGIAIRFQERAALRLLELGADPGAGRGAPWSHLLSECDSGA